MTVIKKVDITFNDIKDLLPNSFTEKDIGIIQVNTVYAGRGSDSMVQHIFDIVDSDTYAHHFLRRSLDNGKTWQKTELIYTPEKTEQGYLRRGESALLFDDSCEKLIYFFNYSKYPKGNFSGNVGRNTRVFYQISTDGGETFFAPVQIIQKGYTEDNPADGVYYGRNSIPISFCAPFITRDGLIILPCQKSPLDYDTNSPFLVPHESGCFIGKWNGDQIDWDLGNMVSIDGKLSSRGLCEPAIAELSDGKILMILRGSNLSIPDVPGRKWKALSNDGGKTWSSVSLLGYDTGESFFSPATGSRLIRSSKNNKLYWIGNILEINPDGNRPRYPLQIAEIDENGLTVIKKSIEIIDTRQPGDCDQVQLSNFKAYEDRQTKEIVVNLSRVQEKDSKILATPSYQYRIKIGD